MKQGLEVERAGLNLIKTLLWCKNSLEWNNLKILMADQSVICNMRYRNRNIAKLEG